jgi:ubiquinone/menaquinone biosynthesis C-methylase UbiE
MSTDSKNEFKTTTDYNGSNVADKYQKCKHQEWRLLESHSFLKHIGDVQGKKCLDMACGEGFITRKLKAAGAATCMGADISAAMIDLARSQEEANPMGITYAVVDARDDTVPQEDFDLVAAGWLLVYAHDRKELQAFVNGISRWVKPGGRFVTVATNVDLQLQKPRIDFRKYGFEILVREENPVDGGLLLWRIYVDEKWDAESLTLPIASRRNEVTTEANTLDIENYYIPMSAYEEAFTNAGFHGFKAHLWEMDPELVARDPTAAERFAQFTNMTPAVVIEVTKNL